MMRLFEGNKDFMPHGKIQGLLKGWFNGVKSLRGTARQNKYHQNNQ
jgi:hypothetical protein